MLQQWAKQFTVLDVDIRDRKKVMKSFQKISERGKISLLLHLASLNDATCEESLKNALEVNVIGSDHIASAADAFNIGALFYFSTIHRLS